MSDNLFYNPPNDGSDLPTLLTTIESHVNDTRWIVANLDCVHKVYRAALDDDLLIPRAIRAFVNMIPSMMLTDDYKEPLDRTFQALLRSMELKDPNLLAQIAGAMAMFYPLKGDIRSTYANLDAALEYAGEANEIDAQLQAYLRILQALSFRHFEGMPTDLIDHTLLLVQFSENRHLAAEVHLTIAYMHNFRQELTQAIEHANIAFSMADQLRDMTYKTRALLMLGVSHRLKNEMDASEEFTIAALQMMDGVNSDRRLGYMLSELAGLRYEQQRFEESESLYLRAKFMFEELDMPYMIILAKHGLGLAWTMLGKFDPAREALQDVLDEYRWNFNNFGSASIKFALGRLEARAGNPRVARKFLRGAEGLTRRLEKSPAQEDMLKWIVSWRKRVEGGEFGDIRAGE